MILSNNILVVTCSTTKNPLFAGMGLTDMGTGTATDTKKGICTRTRDTRIRVPGRFPVPVSITSRSQQKSHQHL
jgi:hypothetical protein